MPRYCSTRGCEVASKDRFRRASSHQQWHGQSLLKAPTGRHRKERAEVECDDDDFSDAEHGEDGEKGMPSLHWQAAAASVREGTFWEHGLADTSASHEEEEEGRGKG